ncbi:MAG: hypothetical protein LBM00_05995 [Deltaproteobacteria bacterium]|jgi:hypothetical protein|nr:hypothetical protein [Deltaproteobacteria bacterium]
MCGGSPKTPAVKPAPVAPAIVAPIEADASSAEAGNQERKRRLAASGRSDTILTSGLGVAEEARVGRKTLG